MCWPTVASLLSCFWRLTVENKRSVISSLLDRIPTIFSHIKNTESALLPTLNAALSALQPTGGKIVCALASLPTYGPGKLSEQRDDRSLHGTDGERKLYTTEDAGWKKTASKMAEAGVGVDFFIASPGGAYTDVATIGTIRPQKKWPKGRWYLTPCIGHVAALTGGETFFYSNFHAPRDVLKVRKELAHAITRETGYQCLMKVRCSNGLQVSSYHGNFVQHALGADLEIGGVDAEKAIGVLFSYDGKLDPKLDAHFQAALLYTSADGQRRVRCINVVAAVNEGGMETMKFVDQDAIVAIIAKEGQSIVKLPRNLFGLIANFPMQPLPRHLTRASRTSVPTSRRRLLIYSVGIARSSPGHTRLDNWFCPRT